MRCRRGSAGSASAARRQIYTIGYLVSKHNFDICVSEVVAMRSAPQLLAAWRWLRVHAACSAPGRSVRRPCRAVLDALAAGCAMAQYAAPALEAATSN